MKAGKVILLSCGLAMLGASTAAVASRSAAAPATHSFHAVHNSSHAGHGWGHGRGRGGYFYYGVGFYGFWPDFYPGYFAAYDGYVVPIAGDSFLVQPAAPVEYVEMAPPPAPGAKPSAANSWYYCKDPDGYYPYVKSCKANWEVVPAQPPGK